MKNMPLTPDQYQELVIIGDLIVRGQSLSQVPADKILSKINDLLSKTKDITTNLLNLNYQKKLLKFVSYLEHLKAIIEQFDSNTALKLLQQAERQAQEKIEQQAYPSFPEFNEGSDTDDTKPLLSKF